ncbi:MAG: SpoIIE family protein phosphatase [Planctomycetota bacterium]
MGNKQSSGVSRQSDIIKPGSSSRIIRPPNKTSKTLHNTDQSQQSQLKIKGLSLGIKYAIFTALTVTIAMILLVLIASSSARKVVDEQINQDGIRLVQTLATIDISYWQSIPKRPPGTRDPLTLLRSEKGKEIGLNVPTILNIIITDINKKRLSQVYEVDKIILVGQQELPPITTADINISEGKYKEEISGDLVRTRMFTKKIVSPGDLRGQGYIMLLLSAQAIDDVLSKIFIAFLLPAFLAILGGGIIGFFMAQWVTKPVKVLMEDMAIVSAGNLSHKSRVTSTDEVGILANAFNEMTTELIVAHQKELETKALEHELNIAREIQYNLLPKEIPLISGFDIAARYSPCFEVSGDYYDILQLDDNNIGIIIADVSGKGIPASMIMTMARSLVRLESERNLSPADTFKKVNRILARDLRRGMFVTSLYYILNIKTGIMKISSAGHNPLVVWRENQNRYELVNPNGIALGFDRGSVFDRTIKEENIQLNPNDIVISFTDGVTETMNKDNQEFGGERFYQLISNLHHLESSQIIDSTMMVLEKFKGAAQQHDDITMVCVKRTNLK